MRGSKISRRYARALLSLGQEDGDYEDYGRNLKEFCDFCTANKEFFQAVSNRVFSVENRQEILEIILARSPFSEVVKNFLRFLLDKNRITALQEITDCYLRFTDEISNVTRAEIITARPLRKETLDKLEEALAGFTSREVRVEVEKDESLIGGLIVKIGDLVLDGSVKAQLEGLRESLKRGEYR